MEDICSKRVKDDKFVALGKNDKFKPQDGFKILFNMFERDAAKLQNPEYVHTQIAKHVPWKDEELREYGEGARKNVKEAGKSAQRKRKSAESMEPTKPHSKKSK